MTARPAVADPVPAPRRDSLAFILVAGGTAFSAYFAMYAFRKPFTAATFDDVVGWPFAIDFKVALVIAQVIGYALSKFIGVKVVSEMAPARRGAAIVGLIGLSWLALVLFAVLPVPAKPIALFLNGLPLGMIWGLVFAFIEGRRSSEILAAILCASFILSSGLVKSAGAWLMVTWQVDALWMPAMTGLLFVPVLLAAVIGLARLPPPSAADIAERVARPPVDAAGRRAFVQAFGPSLVLLVLAYVMFTIIRDFRDNFAAEIWTALGYGGSAAIFSATEVPIAVVTLVILASLVAVRDNARALMIMQWIVIFGAGLIAVSTCAFSLGLLGPASWMIASGLGLYLAYTPFNAMLFDRLVAASGRAGTAAFLIYVADASGYAGSVAVLLLRNLPGITADWLSFYIALALVGAGVSMALMLGAKWQLNRDLQTQRR
jgi:hypothetical protein